MSNKVLKNRYVTFCYIFCTETHLLIVVIPTVHTRGYLLTVVYFICISSSVYVDRSTLGLLNKSDFIEMGIALADYYKTNNKFIKSSTGDATRLRNLLITARSRNHTSTVTANKCYCIVMLV